jgi:hypothetical protein
MAKLELRVRDLGTGDRRIEPFDGEEAAIAWLGARPRHVEVLGVATLEVASDVNARLRAAMRPLDTEEQAAVRALEAEDVALTRAREEQKQQREQAAAKAHRDAMATADPNRPMEVHFRYDQELELTDAADGRAITEEARAAVLAWIAERNEWVEGRGQVVGDAKVTVWPGPLPASAGGERVKGGSFVPVTAPAKA